MKTKTLAVVEIAIVLCSMLLVALPAIAAEQNQATQKVSASTVTAASEVYEPGPLDVFGNANEDDTIDMRDTTYIKLVIFGKKPKTDLADANNDGKVSMLDVGQTKLIILGKEKKLTYVDIFGEAETVNKPIKRLANVGLSGIQVSRALGAMDILLPIVGGSSLSKDPTLFPVISKWPAVGASPPNVDYEYILDLEPDAVQTNLEARFALNRLEQKRVFEEKLPGIPIICLNLREPYSFSKNLRTYGYIIDRIDEAKEVSNWYEGYLNLYKVRTDGLSKDEKPRVYFERGTKPYECAASGSRYGQMLILSGGYNIVDGIVGPDDPKYGTITVAVDPEWVIEQNLRFIFTASYHTLSGYETDDPSEMAAKRQAILDRPELANVDAVKNGRVYVISGRIIGGGGPDAIIGPSYVGKLLQPHLFEDIDAQAVHQGYVDKFHHIDFNVREQGVFIYPPLE